MLGDCLWVAPCAVCGLQTAGGSEMLLLFAVTVTRATRTLVPISRHSSSGGLSVAACRDLRFPKPTAAVLTPTAKVWLGNMDP